MSISGSTRQSSIQTLRDSSWNTCLPFWGLAHASQSVGNNVLTFGANFSLEAPFSAIQLIMANPGAAQTLGAVIAAPSGSRASIATPEDGNRNTIAWTSVTFGGSASVTLPAASVIGAATGRPSLTLSDVIPMESLARLDGGVFPLLYTRCLSPAANTHYDSGVMQGAVFAAYAAATNGRYMDSYLAGGDFVSTPSLQVGLSDETAAVGYRYAYVAGVRFLSTKPCVTIMGAGDSLTAGFVTSSGYNGFGLYASMALSQPNVFGVSYTANGYPGSSSAAYSANAKLLLAVSPPQILTVTMDSPNDYTDVAPGEAATAQCIATQANTLSLVDYAMSLGIQVVALTPIPFGAYDSRAYYGPQRVMIGDVVRALSARGILVLDAQTIISGFLPTVTNLPVLPAAYTAIDTAHLNDAGQQLLGIALASLVQPLLT